MDVDSLSICDFRVVKYVCQETVCAMMSKEHKYGSDHKDKISM
jgi:hypothetical protein